MTDREKLIDLLNDVGKNVLKYPTDGFIAALTDNLIANGVTVQQPPRPLEDWGEDYGDVLWWRFPIEEPPYVGSPLDEKWPGYHTHWTPISVPEPPFKAQEREDNKPLTLAQLQEMNGVSVWVTGPEPLWALVEVCGSDVVIIAPDGERAHAAGWMKHIGPIYRYRP